MGDEIGKVIQELKLTMLKAEKDKCDLVGNALKSIESQNVFPRVFESFQQEINTLQQPQLDAALKAMHSTMENSFGKYFSEASQISGKLVRYDEELKAIAGLYKPEHQRIAERLGHSMSEAFHMTSGVTEAFRRLDERLSFIGLYGADEVQKADFSDRVSGELSEDFREELIEVGGLRLDLIQKIWLEPRLMRAIDPRSFEQFVAYLVDLLGFKDVIVTPRSGDGGQDIFARYEVGGLSTTFAFECKRYKETNKVGVETIRTLLGSVVAGNKANKGVLVTTSSFTKGAKELIVQQAALDGTDFVGIQSWMDSVTINK